MERPCILLSASRSGWQNYENAVLRAGGSVAGIVPSLTPGMTACCSAAARILIPTAMARKTAAHSASIPTGMPPSSLSRRPMPRLESLSSASAGGTRY